MTPSLEHLRVKIYADSADLAEMVRLHERPYIRGFTTNPSLMRKAGVTDYRAFAREVLREIPDRPISFEVIADDVVEMGRQAREIASWGTNVYVKIPITNTQGQSTLGLIRRMSRTNIKVNVTGLLTWGQVIRVMGSVIDGAPSILSVFAGRIADTGIDPVRMMTSSARALSTFPGIRLLWASTREVLNVFQADAAGVDIITVPPEILAKLLLVGRDLGDYSRETVSQFYADATAAGYTL